MKTMYSLAILCLLLSVQSHAQCWQTLTSGNVHNLALKSDGSLWAWGRNNNGQLGDGSPVDQMTFQNTPVQIAVGEIWQTTAAGEFHSLAVNQNGSLWAWGWNFNGQFGDPNIISQNTPLQIGTGLDWKQVSAGSMHSAAIKTDGSLWLWGSSNRGQLGYPTDNAAELSPLRIDMNTNWKTIASGNGHNLALKTDGTLWAWGANVFGQIGNGSFEDRFTPIQIGQGFTWKHIAAGLDFSLAIRSDGTLWVWGANYFGQLGDGTNEHRNTPVQIGSSADWKYVEAGYYHVAAVRTDGTLWTWGYNSQGQLGDGTTNDYNIPIQVGSDTTWIQTNAGFAHTIALKNNGELWAWGSALFGQLGDGTFVDSNMPVMVECPETVATRHSEITYQLEVFPNPTHDYLTIFPVGVTANDLTVEFRNAQTQLVLGPQKLNLENPINVSTVPQGIYVVIVRSKEGIVAGQFVKL